MRAVSAFVLVGQIYWATQGGFLVEGDGIQPWAQMDAILTVLIQAAPQIETDAADEAKLCRILHNDLAVFEKFGRTVCAKGGPHTCCTPAAEPPDCKPHRACS